MKPFSITAPEEIAKEYGGDKRKIQQAASQGLIDPTSAVLAGMFIDRIRGAAAAEQAPQATVAEQVMNPQPQMPSAGLAAAPQAAQMQQPTPPRMGQPSAPQMPQPAQPQMAQAPQMPPQQPQGMAMGGGLDAIPYYEGRYAPGGLVSFQTGGSAQDQMMAQSRALIEALQRSRDPAERRAIQDRLRQLTSAMSVAPPGLVAEPLGPQAGDDRAGLANMDMLRQMEADATARANAPVAPSLDLGMGMENFAEGVVPRPPQGERIDPNRFNTGTLTEEEAMRISQEQGGLGAISTGMTGGRSRAAGAGEGIGVSGVLGQFAESLSGLVSDGAPRGRRAAQTGTVGQSADLTPDAFTGATMPAEQTMGRRITDPEEIARLQATPEGLAQARRQDLSSQFVEQPEDDQFGTITNQIAAEQETARETQPAAGTERTAAAEETEMSLSDEFTAFQDQMKDVMPKNEYGQYRQKFEQLMKDTQGTMERGRKDAFNMALLQAGLGMLGQQGGQTALQALGKAALPATKQYMDTIKDLKKEDRELLKLGLSLEKMDTEERNATFRTMANLFGQKKAQENQLKAAELQRGVDNRVLDSLGVEGYTKYKIDQARAGAVATSGTRGLSDYNADVEKRRENIAKEVNKVTAVQARIEGKSVDELKEEVRASMEKNWPMPRREDYGLSPAQAGGGAAAPMEDQDKNGRPIVSYDGGQNWFYK